MNDQGQKLAIQELLASYANALNAAKADLIPSFYTADGLFMPEGIKTLTTGDQAKTNSGGYLRKSSFNIDYQIKDVFIGDQFAFAQVAAKVKTTDPASGKASLKTSRDFFVLRRKDNGDWKIYRYIFNNVKEQQP